MATMLRSAAMTLLSKTLLTFLYKYLSDVDVEGVEMPSLYGSTEGPGSGWGIRLSSVKLRDGAELMELPGQKRKAKRKSANRQNNNDPGNEDNEQSKKKEELFEPDNNNQAETTSRPLQNRSKHVAENGHSAHDTKKKRNVGKTMYTTANSVTTSSSTDVAGGTMQTERLDSDNDSLSSVAEASLDAGSESPRPDTPVQDSSISFLSCFAPGSADEKGKTAGKGNDEQREQEGNLSSETTSQGGQDGGTRPVRREPQQFQLNGHHQFSVEGNDLQHAFKRAAEEQFPETDEEEEKQDDEDDDDGSPPKILRIGEGGYIGTLDVRLVGRELHVLVEDAFITLEVVTKSDVTDTPEAQSAGADNEDATSDAPTVEGVDKKPTAQAAAAPFDLNDLKTTGERVLAMNAIARILSSIPRLFLRDILVRLVVLDENGVDNSTDAAKGMEENTNKMAEDSIYANAEVVVDLGIGLFSVTEGEDFLSPFDNDDDNSTQDEDKQPQDDTQTQKTIRPQTSHVGASPDNEYLERRIRTGKGTDGGLWLNFVTPKYDNYHSYLYRNNANDSKSTGPTPRWARHEWESTRHCVLRCSGLDAQARIFLGTRKEHAQASSSYLWSDPATYQGIDHTLYGFDHVVPGPTPHTLPPLAPPQSCRSLDEEDDFGNLRSQVYKMDRNGIQSSKIESCFHRVARGMTPTRCTLEHLPCQQCNKCWAATCKRTEEPVDESHYLDSYTPMPGLALSISFHDPLELNVDRLSLDGLGLLIRLFKKEQQEDLELSTNDLTSDSASDHAESEPPITEVVAEPEPSGSYFSYFFGSRTADEDPSGRRFSSLLSSRKPKPQPPAFPSYMKPENTEIIGVYVAEVRLRVHVMRADDGPGHNTGFSFCYWDTRGECLTMDLQKLNSDEKSFQDMRLDLGILDMNEFKGTEQKNLMFAGVPYQNEEKDCAPEWPPSSSAETNRPPWPTTACALLDVPPTTDSISFESRERHGLQLRMLQTCDDPNTSKEKSRIFYNFQMGVAEVDLPWPIGEVFHGIKSEAMKSLFGVEQDHEDGSPQDEAVSDAKMKDKVTQYRAQLGGGRIKLDPLVDIRLPLTRFAGDICPETGFSIETLIERSEISYGQSSKKIVATANSSKGVSLKRLASLPEKVRLRILLFVEDLEPLEKALGVKRQSNSFLRCTAVSKGLGKVGSKKTHKKEGTSKKKVNRRQELMNKLLTLDDDALESLWASHQRKQRKAKKAHTSKKTA